VLQSLLASRLVPVVDLREIFRQAAESTIITSALAGQAGIQSIINCCASHPSSQCLNQSISNWCEGCEAAL
jgi:hypothetical protein